MNPVNCLPNICKNFKCSWSDIILNIDSCHRCVVFIIITSNNIYGESERFKHQ